MEKCHICLGGVFRIFRCSGLSIQGVDGYEREQVVSSLDGTVAHHCLQAQALYQGTYTKQQVT